MDPVYATPSTLIVCPIQYEFSIVALHELIEVDVESALGVFATSSMVDGQSVVVPPKNTRLVRMTPVPAPGVMLTTSDDASSVQDVHLQHEHPGNSITSTPRR
jgi:hypothetical protein